MSAKSYHEDLERRIRAWLEKAGRPDDLTADDVIRGLGRLDLVGDKPSQMAVGKAMVSAGYQRVRRSPDAEGKRPWCYRPVKRGRL